MTKKNEQNYRPTMLLIMDGYGLGEPGQNNAISIAQTPNLDLLFQNFPNTTLDAGGEAVGLPDGQMGNSEVGHLNIGAGRVVYQDLTRISKSVEDGSFFDNPALLKAIRNAKDNNKAFHIMGLVSDGGVHSHISHLYALLKLAKDHNLTKVYIHAFLDGRDTPPRSADKYLKELEDKTKELGGEIVLISGRYYAMDRDKRWERVEKAYDAMTMGIGRITDSKGKEINSVNSAIQTAYANGENDEFILPTIIKNSSIQSEETTLRNNSDSTIVNAKTDAIKEKSIIQINDGDSVVFFNFRPDRAREITRAFVDLNFDGFERKKICKDLCFICMTEYDATMPNVSLAFPPETIKNTLGEYISSQGLKQLRIAETEKYAHVTFFFNGGEETPNEGEDRALIPSPKVATYDLQPEMSAHQVTDEVLKRIDSGEYDLIILNYANDDMVGHTGILEAAVKAVETVDNCVGQVAAKILSVGGQLLITADHGNAENMKDDKGNPVTAHSTNPVPLILVREPSEEYQIKLKNGGKLSDIAPSILDLMEIKIPAEMTGISLVEKREEFSTLDKISNVIETVLDLGSYRTKF